MMPYSLWYVLYRLLQHSDVFMGQCSYVLVVYADLVIAVSEEAIDMVAHM